MKKLIWIVLAVILLTACGQTTKETETTQGAVYVNITAEEAKEVMFDEEEMMIDERITDIKVSSRKEMRKMMLGD